MASTLALRVQFKREAERQEYRSQYDPLRAVIDLMIERIISCDQTLVDYCVANDHGYRVSRGAIRRGTGTSSSPIAAMIVKQPAAAKAPALSAPLARAMKAVPAVQAA